MAKKETTTAAKKDAKPSPAKKEVKPAKATTVKTIGSAEKKLGLDGLFVNRETGKNTRSDKILNPKDKKTVKKDANTTAPKDDIPVKTRKVRSDCTVATFEKKYGATGLFTNENGRKTRGDKLIGTIRKEAEAKKK